MKIARIEQFFPRNRTRLVKVTTDSGLIGWGETTLEGKPKSTHAAVDELTDYLLGKDPLRIEHHWQHIYRSAFSSSNKDYVAAARHIILIRSARFDLHILPDDLDVPLLNRYL